MFTIPSIIKVNFLPFSLVDIEPLEDLLDAIRAQNYLQPLLPVHVSLLRGHFAIRHHHIAPFVRLLQQSLALLRPVSLCLSQLEVFSNENQTKHFLCLCSPFRLKEHPIRELRDLIITARQSLFTIDPSCEVVVSSAPPIIDDFILHASLAVTKRSSLSELHKFIDLTQVIKKSTATSKSFIKLTMDIDLFLCNF